MTTYGVTSTGFVIKPLETIKSELEASQRADINPALNQAAAGVLGQLNGIISAKHRELWELAQAVYNSADPDAAVDASLDNVAAACPGITRNPATKTTVTATCNLNSGTYAAGSLIAHVTGDTTKRFVNTAAVVVSGGPSNVSVPMEAETASATIVLAGTLTVIAEPVTGWNSVTNAANGITGTDAETNEEFRLRREQTIRLSGSSHVDAIEADVSEINSVETVVVFENDTDDTVSGMTPHSIRVVLWDGDPPAADNSVIAETIFESKAGGPKTIGVLGVTVEDDMGYDHTIRFDRATKKTLYVEVDVTTDDDYAGDTAVETAVTALTDDYTIGSDVIVSKITAAVADVAGVVDVTAVRVGWTASPSGTTNLTVASDEIAILQSVTVTSS